MAADVGIINSWSITFSSGGGSAPEVTLGPDITVCPGQVSTLTADVDPSADSYAWSTGESTPSINVSPSVSTTYSVTVTNDGCIGRDTIEVIIDPNGVIADAGPDVSICLNESTVLLGAGGGPGALYTSDDGRDMDKPFADGSNNDIHQTTRNNNDFFCSLAIEIFLRDF